MTTALSERQSMNISYSKLFALLKYHGIEKGKELEDEN